MRRGSGSFFSSPAFPPPARTGRPSLTTRRMCDASPSDYLGLVTPDAPSGREEAVSTSLVGLSGELAGLVEANAASVVRIEGRRRSVRAVSCGAPMA